MNSQTRDAQDNKSDNNSQEKISQTIIRRAKHDKDHPYLMVNKSLIRDKELHPCDKGILIYLLSFPENWKFNYRTIAQDLGIGINQLYQRLKKIITCGYGSYLMVRNQKGQIIQHIYEFTEEKCPQVECEPFHGNPDLENSDYNKERDTNIDRSIAEEEKEVDEEIQDFQKDLEKKLSDTQNEKLIEVMQKADLPVTEFRKPNQIKTHIRRSILIGWINTYGFDAVQEAIHNAYKYFKKNPNKKSETNNMESYLLTSVKRLVQDT